EVQQPVAIVVRHGAGGTKAIVDDARRLGPFREGAVPVVDIEQTFVKTGKVEIGVAIVVDVASRGPVADPGTDDAGSVGHILELAAAEVVVETIAVAFPDGPIFVHVTAVDEEDIHETVLVVVEERNAGPDDFRVIEEGGAALVLEVDAEAGGNVLEDG